MVMFLKALANSFCLIFEGTKSQILGLKAIASVQLSSTLIWVQVKTRLITWIEVCRGPMRLIY